jgi:hypothetical protein
MGGKKQLANYIFILEHCILTIDVGAGFDQQLHDTGMGPEGCVVNWKPRN